MKTGEIKYTEDIGAGRTFAVQRLKVASVHF